MRKATTSDKPLVLNILTRAFDDNKSVNYVVKQDRYRVERIRKLMDYAFNICFNYGEVWMSDDRNACALILFPDQKRTSFRTLWWDLKLAFEVIGISRVSMILKREAMIKAHHPQQPFAYLWFLGVNPIVQGNGAGSKLIAEIIHSMKRPLYLETSMERNLPFYKKFGFEIFQSLQLSYKLYMLRGPVT